MFSNLVLHTVKELKYPNKLPHPKWWAQVDLNHRPHAYQACALTN